MIPVIARALSLLPKVKQYAPMIVSALNSSGIAEHIRLGTELNGLVESIPSEEAIANAYATSNSVRLQSREFVIVENQSNLSVSELTACWQFAMHVAVFGSQSIEVYIDKCLSPSVRPIVSRNMASLLSVTHENFLVAIDMYNNMVKPAHIEKQICMIFLALSQVASKNSKVDITNGKKEMMPPDDIVNALHFPNYIFSGKTSSEEQSEGFVGTIEQYMDWFEEKASDLFTGTNELLFDEDLAVEINWTSISNTANKFLYAPATEDHLRTNLNYLFTQILKIQLER